MLEQPCIKCGKQTDLLDRGMYRKIVNRGAEEFLCLCCLGEKFKIPEETLREKALSLQRNCALFF